ncbi:MAG: EAL domain-containing protein [Colwellia sp.]|nr:EAL domain-containing protein [Colwellia sp.]
MLLLPALSFFVFIVISQFGRTLNNQNSTLNALHDAVIRTDKLGNILYINRSCEQLFSVKSQDFVNQQYVKVKESILTDDIEENFTATLHALQNEAASDRVFKQTIAVKLNGKLLSIEQDVKGVFSAGGTFDGTVIVLRDVTSAEKLRARLRYQANYDSVTKLFNRYKFEQRLVDAWHDAQDNKQQHALLQLDMDRFKLINDNAGHAAGDQLLRDIGQLLKSVVRQSDVCARIGGDEFSVLLLQVSKENTLKVITKINQAIKELTFSYGGQVFDVGASIGATLINHQSPPLVEVKREADAACFMAKNQGVNCYQLFDYNNESVVHHHQETHWAARIQTALEQDQFKLFFQEIKPLSERAGKKQHIEILLRLKDKEQLLSPNVFLPAVERFRLCAQVDYWVMSKTFSWFAEHPDLWQQLVIAINLSGDSLTDEKFIDSIITCHNNYHFPCEAICFEITETAAISNMAMATKMVEKLRFAGFAIALDDFGKGFSTFSYLKNLPAKYIKIDGSYVQNVLVNKYDVAIVKSIQNMASTLDMLTIAEFVQCEKSAALLKSIGIDFVQGFGIAYPAPISDFELLMQGSESAEIISLKVG